MLQSTFLPFDKLQCRNSPLLVFQVQLIVRGKQHSQGRCEDAIGWHRYHHLAFNGKQPLPTSQNGGTCKIVKLLASDLTDSI